MIVGTAYYLEDYLKSCGFQFPDRFLSQFKNHAMGIVPNFALLKKHDLPFILRPIDLAEFLEIKFDTLKQYINVKEEIKPSESPYKIYPIKKKSGGRRYIITPVADLKKIQRKIYDSILLNVKPSRFATGFVPNKSHVKNAQIHSGFQVVYVLDLKNFFPTIKFTSVFAMYKNKFGYSDVMSLLLTLLTTYIPRKNFNGKLKLLRNVEAILPQGAPSSPYISNLISTELDYALYKLARKYYFKYSRYADDITFSSNTRKIVPSEFRNEVRKFIKEAGFHINYQKECISRKKQKITGIIAHESYLALPRKWARNLRSALNELRNLNCDQSDSYILDKLRNVQGRCNYAIGVNKEKYHHYYKEFHELKNSKFKYLFEKKI